MMTGVKGLAGKGVSLLAAALLLGMTTAGDSYGEEEQGFTPIPVIKGMQLLPQGAEAPSFAVRDITGSEFATGETFNGKSHLLVFWSIFCEPCREEMPIIEQMHAAYKDKVDVVAINLDGEPFLEGIRGFVKQYGYSFRVVLDELDEEEGAFKISDPYQVAGTPVLYLIDKGGKVFAGHLGRITVKDLKALIDSMLEKG